MLPYNPQPSVMKHDFSVVPKAEIPRSNFRRSCDYKTTLSGGFLYPIFFDEALPGDTFNVNLSSVCRMNTPIVPFMDNLKISFFFFAVPNRLVWDNWQKFMGEQLNPGDSTDYLVPQINAPVGGFEQESIYDYFGIPTGVYPLSINALHLRAAALIYNEWFRDQNLQTRIEFPTDDGPDSDTIYKIMRRGKRHDYFTSALPWPQKGEAVTIGIGDKAPVTVDALQVQDLGVYSSVNSENRYMTANQDYVTMGSLTLPDAQTLYADLESATPITINSLREAFQLQRMLERDARGGSRYTEILRSHFSVISPDARLQRPEYLGGGISNVDITPIPQTSESGVSSPQGRLAAVGYHSQSGIGFTKSFVEHCTIIGFCSINADLTYQRGLNRMWSRRTRYDYYWPALAHLGEQDIKNKEIYADGSAEDENVFGYQERYAEYRYKPSLITGKLRSVDPQSLDVWHLSQDFGSTRPALNADFIEDNPPIQRVIAVQDEPEFVFNGYFDVVCTRPMPMYSVPGMIDHY